MVRMMWQMLSGQWQQDSTIENLGEIDDVAAIPEWILLTGAIGIVIGMLTLGYKVIRTVGENITKLKLSRFYC